MINHIAIPRVTLSPIEVPKASDVLASELRERILSGEFPEEMPLPPERSLVTQTKMSRTTVREALRILEVQGLVRIKAGRTGGAFVRHPGKELMASTVNLLIRGRRIRLDSLLELREAVEPYCAQLAARNRTEEDLEALDAANVAISQHEENSSQFLHANIEWHTAVATASHNELMAGLMLALSRTILTATENDSFVDAEVREATAAAHESITRAIRKQEPKAALRRMSQHVHTYAEAILQVEDRTEIQVPNGQD